MKEIRFPICKPRCKICWTYVTWIIIYIHTIIYFYQCLFPVIRLRIKFVTYILSMTQMTFCWGASGVCITFTWNGNNVKMSIIQQDMDTVGCDQIYHKSCQAFSNTSIFIGKFKNPWCYVPVFITSSSVLRPTHLFFFFHLNQRVSN